MPIATESDVFDVIVNADVDTGINPDHDAGLLTCTLLTSVDGISWHPVVFEGESAAFVDMTAVMFVTEFQHTLGIAFDESNDFSLFPQTFDTLFEIASAQASRNAVQRRAYNYAMV